jgi:ABC-type transport system involved in multi-copper enzyme maturation permease subunit
MVNKTTGISKILAAFAAPIAASLIIGIFPEATLLIMVGW